MPNIEALQRRVDWQISQPSLTYGIKYLWLANIKRVAEIARHIQKFAGPSYFTFYTSKFHEKVTYFCSYNPRRKESRMLPWRGAPSAADPSIFKVKLDWLGHLSGQS